MKQYREMIKERLTLARAQQMKPNCAPEAIEAKQTAREAWLERKAQGFRDVIRLTEKQTAISRAKSRRTKVYDSISEG